MWSRQSFKAILSTDPRGSTAPNVGIPIADHPEKTMRCLMAGLVFSLVSLQSHAAPTDCAKYFVQCAAASGRNDGTLRSIGETWDIAWFDGFVMGVAQTGDIRFWCLPARYSGRQVSAVVSNYIQAHPEKWTDQPVQLAGDALAGSFPCAKSSTP